MKWILFRDIYFSLVHHNDSLNKVQTFYYLKGTLSGEAANLIKTISASEANYDSAWKILESRYHNKRMLATPFKIQTKKKELPTKKLHVPKKVHSVFSSFCPLSLSIYALTFILITTLD